MKVSDELRDYGRRLVSNASPFNCTFGDIRAYQDELADRIDAEMVELPKDADGVPIHVGDTVWGCISGMQMAVRQLGLTDRWTISTDMGFIPKASAVTHVRPDSFERIADELDEMVDAADSADDRCEKLADLAVRIRKLAKKEGEQCQ